MQKMSLSWYLYYIFLCVKSGSGDSYQHFLKGCRMQAEFGERKGFSGFRVTRDGVNEILKGFDNYEG